MSASRAIALTFAFSLIAAAESVTGGALTLSWKDCGDASTHGKVTGLTPDTLTLGQKTKATGTGSLDEAVIGGSFVIDVSAGIIKKTFTGDICTAKTFNLPLGAGSVTWDGMKCPIAVGAASVAVDILLSSALPAGLAKATIQLKATAKSGDKLLCMEIDTAPVAEMPFKFKMDDFADAVYPGIGELEIAPSAGASAAPPVVFMHGMGDSGSNPGMKSICESVTSKFPGTYSVCLNVSNGASGITTVLDKQLEEFVQAVRGDLKLVNGFNAVGLSQGNLLIRAYIERYNSPKVLTYVSMCGPHGGIQTCPGIYKLVCGLWKHNVYGHPIAFSDYWKDPTDKATYLEKNRFLPDINNEKDTKNATYKANMEGLTKYVLVEAMDDTMVLPHVSEQHGFYAWGSTAQTQQLEETDGYKGDWLGLQTLDKAGKLKKLSYKGNHLRWSKSFWEDTILPFLGPQGEDTLVV